MGFLQGFVAPQFQRWCIILSWKTTPSLWLVAGDPLLLLLLLLHSGAGTLLIERCTTNGFTAQAAAVAAVQQGQYYDRK